MASKKLLNTANGFSIVEGIVGVVVISITTLGAYAYIVNSLNKTGSEAQILNLNIVRTQLVSIVENPLAWSNTIAHNTNLSCFANVLDPSNNNCRSQSLASPATYPFPSSQNLKLYDSQDQLVYDSTVAGTNGLSSSGVICNSFSVTPGSMTCPLQPTISFRAVCPAGGGPCVNPPVVVRVDFLIAQNQQLPAWLNKDRFSVETLKSSGFCPVQATLTSTVGSNATTTPPTYTAPYIDGTVTAKTNVPGNIFLYTTAVNFCARTEVRFQPTVGTASATKNRVCLGYTTSSCEFEWLETSNSGWVLNYNGATVYTSQGTTPYPPSTSMKFTVNNGMVSFYSDEFLLYFYPYTMTQMFYPRFIPAPIGSSPGGMNFDVNLY